MDSGNNLTYQLVNDSVTARIKGRQIDLDSLNSYVLKPSIDVSGLGEGIFKIPLQLSLPADAYLIQEVLVEVKVAKPTPATDGTQSPGT